MDNLQAIAVIIGIVNGVRLLKEGQASKDYWGFILFVIALAVGVAFGVLKMFGLTVETGIVIALASSGLYRVGEKVGGTA
jgi:predicted Kef-type K+ transport protein